MPTVSQLDVVITADTTGLQTGLSKADQGVSQFKNSFATLGSSFSSIGNIINGMGPLVAGAMTIAATAVGALAQHAFEAAVAFDEASDQIRISTGAVGAELTALEGSFKTIFTSIPTSAEDAGKAVSFLSARLHLSGEALEDLATTELELARITGSALVPQLEATTRLFKDWEVATDSQTTSLDFLFKVGQKTAIGVTELAQKLVQFGAPLRAMGFSFEEAAVLIGKFQAEGVELTKVLPGLRIALSKMAKEGITDASEAFSRLIERIKEAPSPLEAVGLAAKVFGQRAGSDMAEAIRQGRFSIEDLMKAVEGSQSTIIQTGQDVNDFSEKWIILKNKASEALEPLGRLVFDALGLVTGAFSDNEAEIKRGWEKFWNDLGDQSKVGVKNLADAIMKADQSPFFQAGEAFGEAFKSGFEKAFDSVMKAIFNIEGPTIISNPLGAAREKINWGAERTKWGGEGFKVGQSLIKGVIKGHDSEAYKSPYFAFDAMDKALDKMLGLADKGKKVGTVIAVSMSAGLKEFLDLTAKATDFILKEVIRDMEELVVAFKAVPQPVIEIIDVFEDMAAATKKAADAARDLIPVEKELEGVHEAVMATVGDTEPFVRVAGAAQVLQSQFDKLSQTLPRAWNTIIDGFVKGGTAASVKVKGLANDIINVFDTLPGKWGQSLQRGLDEFNRWVSFIDSAITLVQRLLGDESPGGLAGVIGSVFKKTATAVQESSQTIRDSVADVSADASAGLDSLTKKLQKSGDEAAATAGKWVAAVAGVAAGISMFIGTRHQGLATGVLGGALGGFTAGAAIGSIIPGLGTLIGGAIGGLIGAIGGLFGTGKSEAQKKAEADAAKAAQMNGQQVGQQIVNTYLDGVSKALDLAPKMAEFEQVSKAQIKAVFKFMTRVVTRFVDTAKLWTSENLAQAKSVAESIGPVFQALAAIPQVATGMNQTFDVPDTQIDLTFSILDRIVDRWSTRAEQWGATQFKKIEKIANRIAPAINLITPLIQAITDTSTVKEPSEQQLGVIDRTLEKIINMVGNLAEKFEKPFLKAMENLAAKVGPALGLYKDNIELIRAAVDVPTLKESDADNAVNGMRMFIDKLMAGFANFQTEGLAKLLVIIQAIVPVAGALKTWLETSELARGYTALGADLWDAVAEDFNRAVEVVTSMSVRAMQFDLESKNFKDYIASGAASLAQAFTMLAQIMNAAGSFFPNGTPVTTQSVPALASGGDIASSGLAFLHAGERVVPASIVSGSQGSSAPTQVHVHVTVNGSLIHESQLTDVIVKAVVQGEKVGRFNKGLLAGSGSIQFAR